MNGKWQGNKDASLESCSFTFDMGKIQRLDTNIVNMSAEWLTFVHTRGLQRKRGKRRLFV